MKYFSALLFALPLFAAEPSAQMVETIKAGDVKTMSELVKTKEDANAALTNGKSVLMLAIWEGKNDIVKILVQKGADINAADEGGKTPLMLAVWRENMELVKFLISKGANKSAKNKDGLTPADVAELSGNGEMIDYFKANP